MTMPRQLLRVTNGAWLLVALAIGLALYACTDETTVLPSEGEPSGVTVAGAGSAFGVPDVAVVTLGVEAEAATVEEARGQAAGSMEGIIQALKDGGVNEDDIQTSRFSVQPRYDFEQDRQVLRGFVVTNIVTAKLREIDKTGELVDAALTAGGDLSRVDNLSFTIDDPSDIETEARRLAVNEARQRAETLADAAGAELGRVLSITESGGAVPVPSGEGDARDEGVTPIEPGELEVQVQVQIVYELKD
ncbi:MAG: SIMPL domain-containing protein [Dehalococcoidia bacterium]